MKRRRIVLNGVLVLALVGVGVGAYASIGRGAATTLTAGQVVRVTRGTLTASVSATGNAEAVTSVDAALSGSGGTVEKIYVKTGEKVKKGQRLLRVDDDAARDDLTKAESDLETARAQLATTTEGRTPAERAQDKAGIAAAQTSVDTARRSVKAAEASYALDVRQQRTLVDRAEDAVDDAEDAEPKVTAEVSSAKNALVQARQTRDSTRLKDRQAIASAEDQLDTAKRSLASERAAVAVNDQPAKTGDVTAAQGSVDQAEIGVRQAEDTLADTTLRAPIAGTVAAVNAVVGESSSAGSGGSEAASSGTDAAGSAGTGSAVSSTTTSSAGSSGLVTIVDTARMQVTAAVAEADVAEVRRGQPVEVMFSASDTTATGTVSAIDTTSTVTNNVVEYGVTVGLEAGVKGIKVGQTAAVTITTKSLAGVLVVPTGAVGGEGEQTTVLRRSSGADGAQTEERVPVETGLVGDAGTEIRSGLAEGDTVVVPTSPDSPDGSIPGGS